MSKAEVLVVPSIAVAIAEEKANIGELTRRERGWYANHHRFQTNHDISATYAQRLTHIADLVHVNVSSNVAPIGRIRNPANRDIFPPYLLRHSHAALQTIGWLWRAKLEEWGIDDPTLRLSATSFARSEDMQKPIVADPTKLAVKESTHVPAASFDMDGSGYYKADRRLGLVSVPHPDRPKNKVAAIASVLMARDEHAYIMPEIETEYNPDVISALLDVTEGLHQIGVINRVVEYAGTSNQCLHIAPNPNTRLWVAEFVDS